MRAALAAAAFVGAILGAVSGVAWAAEPDCVDGGLDTFVAKRCKKGDLIIAFNKDFESLSGPKASDIKVMAMTTGLVFKFPTIKAADGDSGSVLFHGGFKFMSKKITGATLSADPTTLQPKVRISINLAPVVNNDQAGLGPLELFGTLMKMSSGTLRTPAPAIKFSKFDVSWEGPVEFTLMFSLTLVPAK